MSSSPGTCVCGCEYVSMSVCASGQRDEVTTQKQLPEFNIDHCAPDGRRYNLDGAGKSGGLPTRMSRQMFC